MKLSTWSKGISGCYEAFLAIPILGGAMILGSGWQLLFIAFFIHLVTLVVSISKNTSFVPSIFGIVASIAGIIPFVGWFLHTVTAILLIVSGIKDMKNNK